MRRWQGCYDGWGLGGDQDVSRADGGIQETGADRTREQGLAAGAVSPTVRDHIKKAVHRVESGAEIILFGSRARGDARPDSDWDLLILLDGVVSPRREQAVLHRLYDLDLDFEEVLCAVILSRQDWKSPLYRAMPFHHNVDRDGIFLTEGRNRSPAHG
ncbi:MAG: nucleotidyltransferase domain-containing protein [bacterium]|nr:nucleotidyltransferase domain-containing protein [bacterium]